MNSLNEAFEKLNRCMMRTSQTRKMVRNFTEKAVPHSMNEESDQLVTDEPIAYDAQQASVSPILTSTPDEELHHSAHTTPLTSALAHHGSLRRGHDSFNSLSSAGSRSSRKGRRTYNKSRRRAHKKGTLSRTGVVLRPSLAALLA